MPFSEWKTRPLEEPAKKPEPPPPSIWLKWRRRILVVLLVSLVVVAGGLYSTYQATQQAPEFYTTVVATPVAQSNAPPIREVAEEQIEKAETAAKAKSNWRFEFTQDQINEFLAKDLPELSPHVLPPNLKDPRIKIEDGKAMLGCQYDSERFKAVLWLETEAIVSEDGKAIKLIPKNAGAGMLPMPLSRLFTRLKGLSGKTGNVLIEFNEDSPQAIVLRLRTGLLTPEEESYHIESIKFEKEKLSLEGSWDD
jgi:hypothetical protein